MIGQKNLLSILDRQLQEGNLPRFSIIVGPRGSESDKIGPYIASYMGANLINTTDVKVDTIRTIVQEAYKVSTITVYNIINADGMSVQAQNSLLKVTEEPPNKAYFVMTLEDENNTLPTIRSRGTIYHCDHYTQDELMNYAEEKYGVFKYCGICDTPGEIDLLHEMKADEFYEYVQKVADNISTVNGSNAFKIANKIKFKDTDEGYDLVLFWKIFQCVSFDAGRYDRAKLTSTFLALLRTKTINRSMLFDKWILDIRRLPDGCDTD